MFRKILAFLPLAGIVTACSSGGVGTGGVGDTWNPEADMKKANADAEFCKKAKANPTHKRDLPYTGAKYMYLDGNTLYEVAACPDPQFIYQIGKTYVDDGSILEGLKGSKTKYVIEGKDIVEYFKDNNGDVYKHIYKSLK